MLSVASISVCGCVCVLASDQRADPLNILRESSARRASLGFGHVLDRRDSQDLIPDGVLYVGIVLTCTAAVEQDLQLVNSLQFTVPRMPLDAFTNFRHGPVCATDVYAAGAYSCTSVTFWIRLAARAFAALNALR